MQARHDEAQASLAAEKAAAEEGRAAAEATVAEREATIAALQEEAAGLREQLAAAQAQLGELHGSMGGMAFMQVQRAQSSSVCSQGSHWGCCCRRTYASRLALPPMPPCPTAEETQQCADAATEHVRFLEEKGESERAEAEAAAAALQAQLEGVQVTARRLVGGRAGPHREVQGCCGVCCLHFFEIPQQHRLSLPARLPRADRAGRGPGGAG